MAKGGLMEQTLNSLTSDDTWPALILKSTHLLTRWVMHDQSTQFGPYLRHESLQKEGIKRKAQLKVGSLIKRN